MSTRTLHVANATAAKLDRLASRLEQSSQKLAMDALEGFVDLEEEHLAEIDAGLAEADRGEFVPPSEIERIKARYVKNGRG